MMSMPRLVTTSCLILDAQVQDLNVKMDRVMRHLGMHVPGDVVAASGNGSGDDTVQQTGVQVMAMRVT